MTFLKQARLPLAGLTLQRNYKKDIPLLLTLLLLGTCVSASSATTPVSNHPARQNSSVGGGSSPVRMSADKQAYDLEHKRYTLNGHVVVTLQDMTVTGTQAAIEMDAAGKPVVARFFNRPNFKRVKGKVQDTVVGNVLYVYLDADRYASQGDVHSRIATVATDPFYIKSDVQEFDNRNKVVSASGNVQVDYKQSKAWSSLANVRMKDDGKAERVIFSGGARIHQETSDVQGEKITIMVDSGNMIAERDVHSKMDLKTREKPTDPKQVFLTSDYQQYDKAAQTVLASGHVKIIYGDYVAVGPKATFKLKNQELDRIFLTGRPTITENGRVVTADHITITTNPRNFDAVGNVKVSFKTQHSGVAGGASTTPAAGKPGAKSTAKPVAGSAAKPAAASTAKPVDDPTDY